MRALYACAHILLLYDFNLDGNWVADERHNTVQSERAFQKQPHIFQNAKAQSGYALP